MTIKFIETTIVTELQGRTILIQSFKAGQIIEVNVKEIEGLPRGSFAIMMEPFKFSPEVYRSKVWDALKKLIYGG